MSNIPSDIKLEDFNDERRPNANRAHILVLARCAADPKRTYLQHREAMQAEILDRDKPLPAVLDTPDLIHEKVTREAAKTGMPYRQCFDVVMLEQQEVRLRSKPSPTKTAKGKVLPFKSEAEVLGRVREIAADAKPKPATVVPVPKNILPKFHQVAAAIVHLGRRAIRGAALTREDYAAQDVIRNERNRRKESYGGPLCDFEVATRAVRSMKDGPNRDAAIERMTTAAAEIEVLLSKPDPPEAA